MNTNKKSILNNSSQSIRESKESPSNVIKPSYNNDKIEIELISQGAHGCIYRPNINCDTGKPDDIHYVSKIQTITDNIENEINIGENIKKIENYYFYFAPIVSTCITSITKINDSEIKKCNLLNPSNKNYDPSFVRKGELISTKMRYVGEYTLEKYLLSLPKTRIDVIHKKLYSIYAYLLHTLKLLSDNNIIHYDLKENNIMYDIINHSPILIDFGNSFIATDIKTNENRKKNFYTPKFYLYWTIEIHIFSYIADLKNYEDKIKEEEINSVIDEYINNLKKVHKENSMYISITELNEFDNKLKEFFKPYIGEPWEKIFTDLFVPEVYKTFDLYSISITFLLTTYEVFKKMVPINNNISTPISEQEPNKSSGSTSIQDSKINNIVTVSEKPEGLTSSILNMFSSKKTEEIIPSINNTPSEKKDEIIYPEHIDIPGCLSIKNCIDNWKSILLSIPKNRSSVENLISTFILPENK